MGIFLNDQVTVADRLCKYLPLWDSRFIALSVSPISLPLYSVSAKTMCISSPHISLMIHCAWHKVDAQLMMDNMINEQPILFNLMLTYIVPIQECTFKNIVL